MGPGRAALLLAVAALAGAALLALASRTPASVRLDLPGPEATDPDLGARFTTEQVARHGAYRGASYLALGLSTALAVLTLIVAARWLLPSAMGWIGRLPGGWPVAAVAGVAFVIVLGMLVELPVSYVRGFAIEHAWGLSTQGFGDWLGDRARSLGVSIVTTAIGAVAFFGLVRAFPRAWWLWSWVVFSILALLFTLLWPIVIAPLFNRFTPLEDEGLRRRVVALTQDAGVQVDSVLVADASRRTTAENAYVAGIGGSKRMVLYDNLLRAGDRDETAYVVAHELGHEVHSHIWKFVGISSIGLLVGFAALAWVGGRPSLLGWAGAAGIGDVRALPLLLLYALVAGLVALPIQNAVSRYFERQADEVAIELTDDPRTATEVFRRLAFSNIADLRPPKVAVAVLFSHPPIPDRIAAVRPVAGNPGSP